MSLFEMLMLLAVGTCLFVIWMSLISIASMLRTISSSLHAISTLMEREAKRG